MVSVTVTSPPYPLAAAENVETSDLDCDAEQAVKESPSIKDKKSDINFFISISSSFLFYKLKF